MFLFYGPRILLLAAVLPAIYLLIKVYQLDHMEREPVDLIVKLVIYGMIATALAALIEDALMDKATSNFVAYFGVVGCTEEGLKYLFVNHGTWKSREFNCLFDGIVYCISVSLGFALMENILYVFNYGLSVAWVRAITAIPGHACFGIFMGVWYGMAKKAQDRAQYGRSTLYRIMAFIIPVLIHGTYDYLATSDNYWFFLFIVLLFFVSYRLVIHQSNNDQYI